MHHHAPHSDDPKVQAYFDKITRRARRTEHVFRRILHILEVLTVAITRHVVLSHDDPWSNLACIACIAGLFAIRRYLIRRSELKEEMVEIE